MQMTTTNIAFPQNIFWRRPYAKKLLMEVKLLILLFHVTLRELTQHFVLHQFSVSLCLEFKAWFLSLYWYCVCVYVCVCVWGGWMWVWRGRAHMHTTEIQGHCVEQTLWISAGGGLTAVWNGEVEDRKSQALGNLKGIT